jgi:hypothetical protein
MVLFRKFSVAMLCWICMGAGAQAECPINLPDSPTREVLRDCLSDIAKIRAQLKDAHSSGDVPAGAVVAFNRDCPIGWARFEQATGRVIIGAGQATDPKHRTWSQELPSGGFFPVPLTERRLHESGGEERHILTKEQLPAHSHNGYRATGNGDGLYPKAEVMGPRSEAINAATQEAGNGQAFNVMPPYYPLNLCVRN